MTTFDPHNTRYPLFDKQGIPIPHERVVEVLSSAEHALGAANELNCSVVSLHYYCLRANLKMPPSYSKVKRAQKPRTKLGKLFDESGEKDKLAWLEGLVARHGSAQAVEREYGLSQSTVSQALRRLRLRALRENKR